MPGPYFTVATAQRSVGHYHSNNKRVQSDAAIAAGIGAKLGYVTRLEEKPISVNSRRG